jgi:hypothetical protein
MPSFFPSPSHKKRKKKRKKVIRINMSFLAKLPRFNLTPLVFDIAHRNFDNWWMTGIQPGDITIHLSDVPVTTIAPAAATKDADSSATAFRLQGLTCHRSMARHKMHAIIHKMCTALIDNLRALQEDTGDVPMVINVYFSAYENQLSLSLTQRSFPGEVAKWLIEGKPTPMCVTYAH